MENKFMKELSETFSEAHKAEVENLKYEIWAYFNRLRGNLEIEDFRFIFLILELKRKGLLEHIDLSNQWEVKSKMVQHIIEYKEEPYSLVINEIYQIFSREIFDVNDVAFTEFLHILNRITNIEFFKLVYPELFEYFLENFMNYLGKRSNSIMQPIELSQFCFNILELPKNASIYNPFAGLASFAALAPSDSDYKGQEINKQTWALGMLRLMAHEKFVSSEFTKADSISDWAPYFYSTSKSLTERLTAYDKFERKSFDLVISNPPFGLKLPNEYVNEFGYNRTAESYFIDRGMDLLKADGKLLAFVSDNFTFALGREKHLRTKIIDRDLLEAIIHFPSGILKNALIPFSLLVLNKDKKLKQKVKLIDASNYLNGKRKRDQVIDYELLTKEVRKDFDTISQRIVSNAEILENHSKFTVDRYFIDKNFKEIENAIALNELLEHYKGDKRD
jgi:type I restriction enzyme M protein